MTAPLSLTHRRASRSTSTLPTLALACAAAAAVALAPARASADDSAQGPVYVQAGLGVSFWDFPNLPFGPFTYSYSWTGFRPDIEIGYHFSGRHDGFVLGLRQAFIITAIQGAAAGTTVVRAGYDIPIKVENLELNIDPFGTLGVGYIFDGPHAGINATAGLDVKLFFTKGLFAYVRPGELGIQCLHDFGQCAFSYAASLGAGYAFGGP